MASEKDTRYKCIHTSACLYAYICIKHLWKCLKTAAILSWKWQGTGFLETGEGKGLFSVCCLLPFVFCVYLKKNKNK